MSEQEPNNVIDITQRLKENKTQERIQTGDYAPQEKPPTIAELVKRKIYSAVRSVMPPKR
jgi:hypothetical protein